MAFSTLPVNALAVAITGLQNRRVSLRTLEAYLDTLLPEDSTPSATTLGLDKAFVELLRQSKQSLRLVARGCAWLDAQAVKRGVENFAALDETGRETIVAIAEEAPMRSVPRAFFQYTRREAFSLYYSQPASWEGLGFVGPPQPAGFLDFASSPEAQDQ